MEGKIDYESVANSAVYPFSFEYEGTSGEHGIPSINRRTAFGLTKREYFTGIALQGLLSNSFKELQSPNMFDAFVSDAIAIADKVIERLYPQYTTEEPET